MKVKLTKDVLDNYAHLLRQLGHRDLAEQLKSTTALFNGFLSKPFSDISSRLEELNIDFVAQQIQFPNSPPIKEILLPLKELGSFTRKTAGAKRSEDILNFHTLLSRFETYSVERLVAAFQATAKKSTGQKKMHIEMVVELQNSLGKSDEFKLAFSRLEKMKPVDIKTITQLFMKFSERSKKGNLEVIRRRHERLAGNLAKGKYMDGRNAA